jgi:23S rRNA (uridine2552-2'-O)-methyltransferase
MGYRSRAAFKLEELDQKDHLIHKGSIVVDLGAAPGSWSQYAVARTGPTGRVVAVDQILVEPLSDLLIVQGDFLDLTVHSEVMTAAGSGRIDLVLSDMAPNITGVKETDQARCIELARVAREFASGVLSVGGVFVVKLFESAEAQSFRRETELLFEDCTVRKPRSSRRESSEFYLVARQYNAA